jgi:hypothetical protein
MRNVIEQALYDWVSGVLSGDLVIFAEQETSAPKPEGDYVLVQVVSEATISATPSEVTSDTPLGAGFTRTRSWQNEGVGRVDVFGASGRAKIKQLQESLTTRAGRAILKTAGLTVLQPLSILVAPVRRDNRWERRIQADFRLAWVETVDDEQQAIETLVYTQTVN